MPRAIAASRGVHGAGQPQLIEAGERARHLLLAQQRHQLIPHARPGQVAHQPHLHTASGQLEGEAVHVEPVAVLVADGAEDARGVLDEGQVVQHPHDAAAEVALAAVGVEQQTELGWEQRHGHGVDGEVPAVQVLADRGVLDRGQGGRVLVVLGAGAGHVDAQVAGQHHRGVELLVRVHAAVQRSRKALGEGDAVALVGEIDVEAGLLKEQVAHGAAHEVEARVVGGRSGGGPQALQTGHGPQPVAQVGRALWRCTGRGIAQRPQQVAAGDDPEHVGGRVRPVVAVPGDGQSADPA
jgi:hypothetical protein